tara:strand:+ start:86243 stop:87712 length:1470 start_codon:yes stop_codon:yes gene_type:complete
MMKKLRIVLVLGAVACGDPGGREPTDLEAVVLQYESGETSRDEYLAAIAAFEDDGSLGQRLSGTLQASTLVHARSEPYVVDNGFTIKSGTILVIEEGARLEFALDAEVEMQGQLYAVAPEGNPIVITAAPGETYADLFLRDGPNQFVGVDFSRAERSIHVTHDNGVKTLVERGTFNSWRDLAIAQNNSIGLHVLNSRFGYETPDEEVSGETIRTRNSGGIIIEGSSFSYRTGYRDVLDLQDCRKDPDEWAVVIGNTLDGGEDDGVDLDNCSAIVVDNLIRNFRPIDLTRQDAGVNGGGITGDGEGSTPFIANNIVEGCFHGIGFKNGARPAIVNNTVINSNIGITLYQSAVGNPMPQGIAYNNVLAGNVGWLDSGANDIVLNGKWWAGYNQVDDVQATIDAQYNIFATLPSAYPGEGNSNSDPLLDLQSGLPELSAGSPAIDQGMEELILPDFDHQRALEYLERDFAGRNRARTANALTLPDLGALEAQ